MKKNTPLLLSLILAVFCGCLVWIGDSVGATAKAITDAQTRAVVTATTAFLNSLSADQRTKVQFPFRAQKAATAARFSRSGMGGPGGPGPGMGPAGGDTIVNAFARHALWIAVALFLVSLAFRFLPDSRPSLKRRCNSISSSGSNSEWLRACRRTPPASQPGGNSAMPRTSRRPAI